MAEGKDVAGTLDSHEHFALGHLSSDISSLRRDFDKFVIDNKENLVKMQGEFIKTLDVHAKEDAERFSKLELAQTNFDKRLRPLEDWKVRIGAAVVVVGVVWSATLATINLWYKMEEHRNLPKVSRRAASQEYQDDTGR